MAYIEQVTKTTTDDVVNTNNIRWIYLVKVLYVVQNDMETMESDSKIL